MFARRLPGEDRVLVDVANKFLDDLGRLVFFFLAFYMVNQRQQKHGMALPVLLGVADKASCGKTTILPPFKEEQ